MTVQGNSTPTTMVCVAQNTAVQWVVTDSDATSYVDVRFGTGPWPFGVSSLQADSLNPAVVSSLNQGCYNFAITDCQWQSGGACAYADPKVVVTPPGAMKKHPPKKDKDNDKDMDKH